MDARFSVNPRCPHCTHSLVDPEISMDGEPSLRLLIRRDGVHSWACLSPIWGSPTVQAGLPMTRGEVTDFACPHCAAPLAGAEPCARCGAPLMDLSLPGGGHMLRCTRWGCPAHALRVDDPRGFLCTVSSADNEDAVSPVDGTVVREAAVQVSCPHCMHLLTHEGMVHFGVLTFKDERGFLETPSLLRLFAGRPEPELFEGIEAADLFCVHCQRSLRNGTPMCPNCSAPQVRVSLMAMGRTIAHEFCPCKNCKTNSLSEEDLQAILLEDSHEW